VGRRCIGARAVEMIGSTHSGLVAAAATMLAIALIVGGAAIRWLRMDGADARSSPRAIAGHVAVMTVIATLAATLIGLAVGLMAGEEGGGSGWAWLSSPALSTLDPIGHNF